MPAGASWTSPLLAIGIVCFVVGLIPWLACLVRGLDPDAAPRLRDIRRTTEPASIAERYNTVWLYTVGPYLRHRRGLIVTAVCSTALGLIFGMLFGGW